MTNTKKDIDNDIINDINFINNESNITSKTKKVDNKTAEKVDNKAAGLESISTESDEEYTIDPHTNQKYLKPKGTSELIIETNYRIPRIQRPGFEIIWPINRTENTFYDLVKQGWEFVDPSIPGCEAAAQIVPAGLRPDGKSMYHRAMQMPIEKYQALQEKKQKINDDKEENMIFDPTGGDKNMYKTREHRSTTTRGGGDMDIDLANAYKKSMR